MQDCNQREQKAFRYCHDPIETKVNHLPVPLIPGTIYQGDTRDQWGLSFYASQEAAMTVVKRRCKSTRKFLELVGTHLVETDLLKDHGECDEVDKYGHFNLFEYQKYTFLDKVVSYGLMEF
jgi:hypothetical protein